MSKWVTFCCVILDNSTVAYESIVLYNRRSGANEVPLKFQGCLGANLLSCEIKKAVSEIKKQAIQNTDVPLDAILSLHTVAIAKAAVSCGGRKNKGRVVPSVVFCAVDGNCSLWHQTALKADQDQDSIPHSR